MSTVDRIAARFDELSALLVTSRDLLPPAIARAAELSIAALERGNKLLICGNGGSAADAQHFAAELVGRFQETRRALAAIALTTDSSILTAVANDTGYDRIFERQVEALARPGDVLFAISTSGRSPNVVAAARAAAALGCAVVAMTGDVVGPVGEGAAVVLRVPSTHVARVQELHELSLHTLTEVIDGHFAGAT